MMIYIQIEQCQFLCFSLFVHQTRVVVVFFFRFEHPLILNRFVFTSKSCCCCLWWQQIILLFFCGMGGARPLTRFWKLLYYFDVKLLRSSLRWFREISLNDFIYFDFYWLNLIKTSFNVQKCLINQHRTQCSFSFSLDGSIQEAATTN